MTVNVRADAPADQRRRPRLVHGEGDRRTDLKGKAVLFQRYATVRKRWVQVKKVT